MFRSKPIVEQEMAKTKKISISTESHEIYIMRTNGTKTLRGSCVECRGEVELLTLDDAVSISGRNTGDLIRRVESGLVHSVETASGHWLVCRPSLNKEQ